MKKLFTLILVLAGFVGTVSASETIWLRTNVGSWDENLDAWKIEGTWNQGDQQDVYEFDLPASKIGNGDFYFRLFRNNTNFQLGPYNHTDYAYQFTDGNTETYTATANDDFKGENGAFLIKHSEIKASQYKISIYVKYPAGSDWIFYIKVDIVSIPATVSSTLGYSTFSCVCPVDFTDVTDVTAYRAEQTNDNKVLLKKVTGKVAARTGLVLKGTSTIIPTASSGTSYDLTTPDGNYLMASVNATTITPHSGTSDYYYFLSGTSSADVGFYQLENDKTYTSAAGKAYYHTPTPLTTNAARAAWIIEGEETQGINNVESTQNADIVYDLQGRVAKTAKAGLYIKNGKKVVMK
ncbi:MAG: hypothetical protein J6W19_03205 [Prevotella sp.]|nr:hypothetical protein [Prevotella sp.]